MMIIPALSLAVGCSSALWFPKLIKRNLSINSNMIVSAVIMMVGSICLVLICTLGIKTELITTLFISLMAIGIGFLITNCTAGILN